ncbi:MAG: response regulator [Actinomycetota bacterium]
MTRCGDGGSVSQEPPAQDAIRILVADDHELFRSGLAMMLSSEDGIEVVGEAGDGAEAVRLAVEHVPDVILMDVRMPKRSGIEATQQIREEVPSARILMLTVSDEEADLYDAVKSGATGYLLKDASIDEVLDAIKSVQAGQSTISPSMASKLMAEFSAITKKQTQKSQPGPKVTDREMEVLQLVAKGMSNREIAKALFISENTVKNHIRNILEKLQLHSRMQAVYYAVREGLIEIN